MAPHSSSGLSRPSCASQWRMRVRLASISSASSSSSSDSEGSDCSSINGLDAIRQAYSKTDSVSSDSSLASSASLKLTVSSDTEASSGSAKTSQTKGKATKAKSGRIQKKVKTSRIHHAKGKTVNKPRKDAVEKLLREEASADNFPLANLKWSEWKRAIQRKHPQSSHWESRFVGHRGVRRRELFTDMKKPAVYEVAIKVPDNKEKIPVLASVKQGIQGQSWEAALLSKDKLRSQVDRVLKRGCKLYVRQAPFSVKHMPTIYDKCDIKRKAGCARSTDDAVHELRGLMARVCDYAWRDHYDIPSRTYSHRGLVVKGVKVSD